PRGDLQPIEAAPRDADDADLARAPALSGDPVDDLERVVLLLLQVFIEQQAVGFARAAHVDADAGIAVPGIIGMGKSVALRRTVALAIGQVFQDCRHRIALLVLGQPYPGSKPGAIGKGNPGIGGFARSPWKSGDDIQGRDSASRYSIGAAGRGMGPA